MLSRFSKKMSVPFTRPLCGEAAWGVGFGPSGFCGEKGGAVSIPGRVIARLWTTPEDREVGGLPQCTCGFVFPVLNLCPFFCHNDAETGSIFSRNLRLLRKDSGVEGAQKLNRYPDRRPLLNYLHLNLVDGCTVDLRYYA